MDHPIKTVERNKIIIKIRTVYGTSGTILSIPMLEPWALRRESREKETEYLVNKIMAKNVPNLLKEAYI